MRGHNTVIFSGNIGGTIVSGETKDKRPAFSFGIASQNEKHRTTWARVNSYDKLAEYCSINADKGGYVSVIGELMNRDGKYGELTEIRAHQVIFHRRDSKGDEEDAGDGARNNDVWADERGES
jgi:single-stranded DNA-binding protein